MTIGTRIRQARESGPAGKVSRKDLASAAGIAYSTLADIENGYAASTTRLHHIAKRLKVSVEWLETGKGGMSETAPLPQSQSVRLNPVIVRVVAQALRETFHEELGRVYSIEEHPELFAGLYERTAARGDVGGNLVWLGMQIRGLAQQGAPMDERSGVVADGESNGKGDVKHPRKKAKA
jgi:transcriptional regulator with XRE-family HTH domain